MPEQILVYPLVPPKDVVANARIIAAALFGMRDVHDGERELTVSEASGCIGYTDRGRIWKNQNPGALAPDAKRAQKVAEDWIAEARKRLARAFERGNKALARALPPGLQHLSSVPIANPERGTFDHWLTSFTVVVPTGRLGVNDARAPVDCIFEIRMGAGGAPVGLVSSWRPYASSTPTTLRAQPEGAQLIYRMEGRGVKIRCPSNQARRSCGGFRRRRFATP